MDTLEGYATAAPHGQTFTNAAVGKKERLKGCKGAKKVKIKTDRRGKSTKRLRERTYDLHAKRKALGETSPHHREEGEEKGED